MLNKVPCFCFLVSAVHKNLLLNVCSNARHNTHFPCEQWKVLGCQWGVSQFWHEVWCLLAHDADGSIHRSDISNDNRAVIWHMATNPCLAAHLLLCGCHYHVPAQTRTYTKIKFCILCFRINHTGESAIPGLTKKNIKKYSKSHMQALHSMKALQKILADKGTN